MLGMHCTTKPHPQPSSQISTQDMDVRVLFLEPSPDSVNIKTSCECLPGADAPTTYTVP